jgi:cytochrome P450
LYAVYEDDAMRAHMQDFSKGSHACLGETLVLIEIKLVMAELALRFLGAVPGR